MTYMGTEAYDLDASRGAFAPQGARSFETIEGAGLDARERAGVSRQVLSTLKVLAAIAAVFMVLSAARVGVFTYAATILSQNSTMRSELKEARSLQDDLRVQRSVLSSASRIDRIATQSYGMVLAGDPVKLAAGDAEAAAAAEAEARTLPARMPRRPAPAPPPLRRRSPPSSARPTSPRATVPRPARMQSMWTPSHNAPARVCFA